LVLYEIKDVKSDAELMKDLKERAVQISKKLEGSYGIARFGMRAVATPPAEPSPEQPVSIQK